MAASKSDIEEKTAFFTYCKEPVMQIEALIDSDGSLVKLKEEIKGPINILKTFSSESQQILAACQEIRAKINARLRILTNSKETALSILEDILIRLNYVEKHMKIYGHMITQIEALLDARESLAAMKEKIKGPINILKHTALKPLQILAACEEIKSKIMGPAQLYANFERKKFDLNYKYDCAITLFSCTDFEALQAIWSILNYVQDYQLVRKNTANHSKAHAFFPSLPDDKTPSTESNSSEFIYGK